MKIKKLLQELIETQKLIADNLKMLNSFDDTSIITSFNGRLTSITSNVNCIQTILDTNIYTKDETINAINKEIDYKKEYDICKEKNPELLELIENYCKYENKYSVIDIFRELESKYVITKVGE